MKSVCITDATSSLHANRNQSEDADRDILNNNTNILFFNYYLLSCYSCGCTWPKFHNVVNVSVMRLKVSLLNPVSDIFSARVFK